MIKYLNFFFSKYLIIYFKHFKVNFKKKQFLKLVNTVTLYTRRLTKKIFFKSIKMFFFFKKNPSFKRIRREYKLFKKIKSFFKKPHKIGHFRILLKNKFFKKRNKFRRYLRRKKSGFFFIKQNKLFLQKKSTFLGFLMSVFKKKYINSKFFFKKTNLMVDLFNYQYYSINNIFKFIFKFSINKFYRLKYLNLIYIDVKKKNKNDVLNSMVMGVGDRISLFISEKLLILRFLKLFKGLYFLKKYKKIFKFKYKNKYKWSGLKKKRPNFDFLCFFYKNIEFCNFNNNIFYVYNLNFFFFNYFFKKYINVFSWRLYNWSRILKYRR